MRKALIWIQGVSGDGGILVMPDGLKIAAKPGVSRQFLSDDLR